MSEVVGVRLKRAGKIYYFDPGSLSLSVGEQVVVNTTRGFKLGQVVIAPAQVLESELTEPLQPVVRKATPDDIRHTEEFNKKEREALIEASKVVARLQLPMKLLVAEYNLTGNRLTIFFKAEKRVDFRELVQELTNLFKARVELRQIGPRDEAKLVGDFGKCGRPLCCASYLSDFAPVSIRMAKEQELPLNPMKISGVCGRLQCCLTYENEQYRAMKQQLPRKGQRVRTPEGVATVVGSNLLKQTLMVELESQATIEVPASRVTVIEEQKPPSAIAPAEPQTEPEEIVEEPEGTDLESA
ncbi:MAG: stage 0 sporulation family protein [Chloroflexi bacterium]|nr:stage 0 sporulation family protein [Chloroflexota bacterium]